MPWWSIRLTWRWAIRYRPGEDAAPRVTPRAKGRLAEIMRELARENGILSSRTIALARLLYRRVKVGPRCRRKPIAQSPRFSPLSTAC